MNLVRIWHDNSGKGSNASWFLKYIIVKDMTTQSKFYFICNDWLAVDKSDGSIQRALSVAGDKQKLDFKYLVAKQANTNLRDNHLWFSVWAKSVTSTFSRVDRLTCCLLLLCLSMLLNILYYESEQSAIKENPNSLKIGPLTLTPEQVNYFNLSYLW